MDIKALEERKLAISRRLDAISVPLPKNTLAPQTKQLQPTTSNSKKKKRGRRSVTPIQEPDDIPSETAINVATSTVAAKVMRCDKIDTHWDYLLKEMKWLAADFQAERKRHVGFSKKMAVSATVYCEGAVAREVKSIQDATIKQRKLAARIARETTKKFWSQIHRVITYKQKLSYDTMRHNAMNQQLVQLVQQTEKYTALLSIEPTTEVNGLSSNRKDMSIEQALAITVVRRSKNRVRDYAQLLHDVETTDGENSYYGESTDENSGSDATYINEEDDHSSDDESTLRAAEMEEWRERHLNDDNYNKSNDIMDEDTLAFEADPIELQMLQEEAEMDIHQVVERLKADSDVVTDILSSSKHRHVRFLDNEVEKVEVKESKNEPTTIPIVKSVPALPVVPTLDGSDADDDMDASDVDDYDDSQNNKEEEDDDEFVVDIEEVDDETTMEQEEMLPRDISVDDELRLLQQENELSVEELRKLYSGAFSGTQLNENTDQADAYKEEQPSLEEQDDMNLDEVHVGADNKASATQQLLVFTSKKEANIDADDDEEDYVPEESVDDETTIEVEEKLGRDMTYAQELSILQRESEMSVDELRAMYTHIDNDSSGRSPIVVMESTADLLDAVDDQENDEEFIPNEDEPDDESTLEAEIRLGSEINPTEEIDMLKMESELPIEDLKRKYDSLSAVCSDSDGTPRTSAGDKHRSNTLVPKQASEDDTAQSREAAAIVSRPFLIPSKVTLREYQHAGLSWLVSLQSRRLNGILADGTKYVYRFRALFFRLLTFKLLSQRNGTW